MVFCDDEACGEAEDITNWKPSGDYPSQGIVHFNVTGICEIGEGDTVNPLGAATCEYLRELGILALYISQHTGNYFYAFYVNYFIWMIKDICHIAVTAEDDLRDQLEYACRTYFDQFRFTKQTTRQDAKYQGMSRIDYLLNFVTSPDLSYTDDRYGKWRAWWNICRFTIPHPLINGGYNAYIALPRQPHRNRDGYNEIRRAGRALYFIMAELECLNHAA